MARQGISTGTTPNDGTGDNLLTGAVKINENFSEVYSIIGDGTNTYVGIVTQIVAGSNVSISTSYGSVTITSTGGGSLAGVAGTWAVNSTGISTNKNVGIGTTTASSALTVSGDVSISGVSTFNSNIDVDGGDITFQSQGDKLVFTSAASNPASGGCIEIQTSATSTATISGSSNQLLIYNNDNSSTSIDLRAATYSARDENADYYALFNSGSVRLYHPASAGDILDQKFETVGTGVTVTGTTFSNQLNVSGVSTFSSDVSIGGTISVDGGVTLTTNNPTISGTIGTTGEIKQIGGAPFFYDGSEWREFVLSSGTPVAAPADTDWDSVILRMDFENDFSDEKFGVSPIYVGSGATTVGAAVTIGNYSFRNDGSVGSGISFANRSEYDFTGSWTIEFWIYFDQQVANGSYNSLVSMASTGTSGDEGNTWVFGVQNNGFNHYFAWTNENNASSNTVLLVANSAFASNYINNWNHIALVRESDNGSIHCYVNGEESVYTASSGIIDNNIVNPTNGGLFIGGGFKDIVNSATWNLSDTVDAYFDDLRISAGVGTAGQRYTSIGISTYATFTPPATALPISGTLSSIVVPPGDKYGEIGLGTSPTWTGTSGNTVTQQSSGNYRLTFTSSYDNNNDYFVLTQPMDQGFASYVGVARSTSHIDFTINKQSDDSAVDVGSLSVQIKNHL